MSLKETNTNKMDTNKINTNKMDTDSIYIKINKLYAHAGYMSRYGSDVWATVIICVIFLLLTNYYIFTNALEVIRSDWTNQRCAPLVLPFAGFINKPSDQSNLEFTISNFNDCVNGMLKQVVDISVQPLYFAVDIIQEAVNNLIAAFDELRKLTAGLREEFSNIAKQLYAGIANIVVFFLNFTVKMKDSMEKINGVLTVSLYTLFGSYMAAESLFLSIIDLILIILIVLVLLITLYWAIALGLLPIPIVGFSLAYPNGWWAVIFTIIMIAILIPVIWFESMLLRVMDLSTPSPPGVPGCFAGGTLIELYDNHKKPTCIKDIRIGDKLKNGSTVTALLKFSSEDQNVYLLNNILVTGEHRVFHPTLKWIKVKAHPDSIYMPSFNESYVYCLGTSNKEFTIGDTVFSDWDDIDSDVLEDLSDLCPYLPSDFKLEDIHTHLDSGFHASSTVVLEDGSIVSLKDVKVNDKLLSGDKVVGVVKIAAHDMTIYNYKFQNDTRTFCGTLNVTPEDNTLGMQTLSILSVPKEDFMYHLLTDTSFFVVNNIRVHDYNFGIDRFLRNKIA